MAYIIFMINSKSHEIYRRISSQGCTVVHHKPKCLFFQNKLNLDNILKCLVCLFCHMQRWGLTRSMTWYGKACFFSLHGVPPFIKYCTNQNHIHPYSSSLLNNRKSELLIEYDIVHVWLMNLNLFSCWTQWLNKLHVHFHLDSILGPNQRHLWQIRNNPRSLQPQ